MPNIFVVEDSDQDFKLIESALSKTFSIARAKNFTEATQKFNPQFDSVLVDVCLPDGDGYQICDWIRRQYPDFKIPIIFVSASDTIESRKTGYEIGGDDYIPKPFDFDELVVRIEAKLRNAKKTMYEHSIHNLKLNVLTQKVSIRDGQKTIELDLTPIEFKILNLLVSEPEKIFTREEIVAQIWGKDIFIYPRSVDTHVSKLRTKLGLGAHQIKSAHGIGYKYSYAKR